MLPTYSPPSPVCCQPTALLALYVATLQHSQPRMLPSCGPPGPVCCRLTALLALYVANLHQPCMLPTYSPPSLLALYVADLQPS